MWTQNAGSNLGGEWRSAVRVEEPHLLVRTGVVLPPRCVDTNRPVSEEDVRDRRLIWCPPWVGLGLLLGPLLFLIIYLASRQTCLLAYGVHPDVAAHYRKRIRIKATVTVALFLAIPFAAATDSDFVMVLTVVLFLISFILLLLGNAPLRATGHRDGMSIVKGCPADFLGPLRVTIDKAVAARRKTLHRSQSGGV